MKWVAAEENFEVPVLDGLRRATTEHRVPEHPVQVCHCGARNSATVPAVSWQEAEPLTVNKCVNLDHVRARTLSNTGSIRSLLDGRPKLGTAIAVRLGMAAGGSVQAQGVLDDMTMLRWTRQCFRRPGGGGSSSNLCGGRLAEQADCTCEDNSHVTLLLYSVCNAPM